MKYHSAFARAYADRNACVEKGHLKERLKGKTVLIPSKMRP